MTELKDLAARLVEVESHLAHQDRAINDLSDMIAKQWDTLNSVLGKLDRLEARLRENLDQEPAAEEPPPPHY